MHPEENKSHMMWMALLCHLSLKEKNHFFPGTNISKLLLKIDHSMSINRTFKAILVNVKFDTHSVQFITFSFFFKENLISCQAPFIIFPCAEPSW